MTYQTQVRRFMARYDLGHTPQVHALDLVAEVGEVAKALLEASDYGQSWVASDKALAEELGDAFYSLVALANSVGVDLETALRSALDKYETRFAGRGHSGSA